MTKDELLEALKELVELIKDAGHASDRIPTHVLHEYNIYKEVDKIEIGLAKYRGTLEDVIYDLEKE